MEYLRFENGVEISSADLAAAVRLEGQLGTGRHFDSVTNLRCVLGVALNLPSMRGISESVPEFTGNALATYNDAFVGSPTDRAEAVARYVESEIWALEAE